MCPEHKVPEGRHYAKIMMVQTVMNAMSRPSLLQPSKRYPIDADRVFEVMKNSEVAITTCDTADKKGCAVETEDAVEEQPEQCQCHDARREEEGGRLFRVIVVILVKAKEEPLPSMKKPAMNWVFDQTEYGPAR